jgi:hypothetical protein
MPIRWKTQSRELRLITMECSTPKPTDWNPWAFVEKVTVIRAWQ